MDERDTQILNERQAAFLARTEPKQGDFILFKDGTYKRIAHVWKDENDNPAYIQPTEHEKSGGFYLGCGYMSFSGSLDDGIPAEKFTRTNEYRLGHAWFFHHDFAYRDNGVNVIVSCPVWECDL